jgi:hypothetical protein
MYEKNLPKFLFLKPSPLVEKQDSTNLKINIFKIVEPPKPSEPGYPNAVELKDHRPGLISRGEPGFGGAAVPGRLEVASPEARATGLFS